MLCPCLRLLPAVPIQARRRFHERRCFIHRSQILAGRHSCRYRSDGLGRGRDSAFPVHPRGRRRRGDLLPFEGPTCPRRCLSLGWRRRGAAVLCAAKLVAAGCADGNPLLCSHVPVPAGHCRRGAGCGCETLFRGAPVHQADDCRRGDGHGASWLARAVTACRLQPRYTRVQLQEHCSMDQ